MIKKIVLITSLFPLFIASPALAVDSTGTQSFTVPATVGDAPPPTTWFDTGFDLLAGNPVTLTASGIAQFCPFPGLVGGGGCSTTPDGPIPGSPLPTLVPGGCPACPAPGIPLGTLITQVGTGTPMIVGSGPTILTGIGRLYFAYNDGYSEHYDNSGNYAVVVTYSCKPGNGFGDKKHYHCGSGHP